MVMDFSKLSDDELLSMYNSSQPTYGVDRHSIMNNQSLNDILPNRAIIQDFVNKEIYSPKRTSSDNVNNKTSSGQVVNKQPVVNNKVVKSNPATAPQVARQTTKAVPTETIQEFVYETPEAKQDYINRIEEFATNYPAMVEQDRRRRMQAALLAPVIGNDRFVDEAIGQGTVDTTAKQLELLNTAANARVSEKQKPILAAMFAQEGLNPAYAYLDADTLGKLSNIKVAQLQAQTGKYKADMAAQTGMYRANSQLEGIRIATAAKQGPEKLVQVLGQAGYSKDEINNMLENVYGSQWKSMIGRPTNVTFERNTENEVYDIPEQRDYFNF